MEKLEKIYEGKAKIIYSTADEDLLIQYFKDDATAFNAQKKAIIANKGILNNKISEALMKNIIAAKIPCHFVKKINDREQVIKKLKIIPLEIIIRNIAAGSMSKRLGIKEGSELIEPIFELCYKEDSLNDPLINDDHAINVLKVINKEQLELIKKYAFLINKILINLFLKSNLQLVDFKIEFGFNKNGEILLADEISPDSCRLWDIKTKQRFDKDLFRRDLGDLIAGYEEVLKRITNE